MEAHSEKRFHNLTLEQIQALDKVLTEVIPIHGRGNFPTLQVRAKDIIRVVKDRLVERDIHVKDIRLNGATASHILVRDNCLGYRDLDIIFGVELPRQEDFQVIKEVVLGSLRDLLPCGVNRRKITCLTMKEAYVQKMVKVSTEHDRWSLILLSNNKAKTVGLRFVSSLRRQFEFSVDSFQIILDRMLESYWEMEKKKGSSAIKSRNLPRKDNKEDNKVREQQRNPQDVKDDTANKSTMTTNVETPFRSETISMPEKELLHVKVEHDGKQEALQVLEPEGKISRQDEEHSSQDVHSEEDIAEAFELSEESGEEKQELHHDFPSKASQKTLFPVAGDTQTTHVQLNQESDGEPPESKASLLIPVTNIEQSTLKDLPQCEESVRLETNTGTCKTENSVSQQGPQLEFSFPPPAKKTCSISQEIVPDYYPSPKLQRKMSRKLINKPEKWSLLTDLSDLTTQLFPPIEIPKPLQRKSSLLESAQTHPSDVSGSKSEGFQQVDTTTNNKMSASQETSSSETVEQTVKLKHSKKPPDLESQSLSSATKTTLQPQIDDHRPELSDPLSNSHGPNSWIGATGEPAIIVEAECMYGDFEQAMDHLRQHLIATHNPEEIRGGGLLKYSDLLVRNFKPASETEIKSLERYMCSRFFIDFPDVSEQQRKIEAHLQCHFIGNEETSKYDYLMTLRRVIDESTVCLMGHERRQTLNMITVLALKVLGEQNAIPNTANVTCFYQPAPYMAEPIYNSFYIAQAQPQLVYHPYPLQVHMQTGLV